MAHIRAEYLKTAREIIKLQKGMIVAAVRGEEKLDEDFWHRFYILTGQFFECSRSAKQPILPAKHSKRTEKT